MSTVEDFESAPIGATATNGNGSRATKIDSPGWPWETIWGTRTNNYMVSAGYTLDPSSPTTAREALDLAWELAHPVKEGQTLPVGTDYLVKNEGNRPATIRSSYTHTASAMEEEFVRTFDPLPDPVPEWTKAPAVIARPKDDTWVSVWGHCHSHDYDNNCWESSRESSCRPWQDLRDIEPLYTREEQS